MINEYDIIIIGAGPAGLFTAINIQGSKNILILEKNKTCGMKLLASGSGRCNITQSVPISDFFSKYGDNKRFITPALKEFTNVDLMNYLRNNGLETISKNGKVFPSSERSSDVLNLLLHNCKRKNISIQNNEEVNSIKSEDNGFLVTTKKNSYKSNKLVIAVGGKSYPTTGSTGDGYNFAESLGHRVIKAKPALAPVYIKDYKFAELSGISLKNRNISLFRDNVRIRSVTGDFGFTHWGLSGPAILDLSRYIEPGDLLRINLIDQNPEQIRTAINKVDATEGKLSIKSFLRRYAIPENLIKALLLEKNIDYAQRIAELKKSKRNSIVELSCSCSFVVKQTGDFNIAMVTKGGISLDEVSSKTMESKLVQNLYFVGEVLDIDGDTGGYNLQAAFSTAYLAAKSL